MSKYSTNDQVEFRGNDLAPKQITKILATHESTLPHLPYYCKLVYNGEDHYHYLAEYMLEDKKYVV